MKTRYSPYVVVPSLLMLVVLILSPHAGASNMLQEATPAAEQSPEFAMIAVGDHPNGYFEDVEIAGGDSADLEVRVFNTGSVSVNLKAYKVNALNGVNGGYVSGLEDDSPQAQTEWIDFPTTTFELVPGESRDIAFNVSVPEGTSPGQYISGLVVEAVDTRDLPGSNVLDYRLGYAISLSVLVPGELNYQFELGEPEVVVERSLPNRLQVPISNTGNYLIRPEGDLTLSNSEGEVIHSSHIAMGSVYAGQSPVVQVTLPDQMPVGEYTVDLALTDPDSGVSDAFEGATVTVPEPVDPTGVFVESAVIEPNAEEIVFANVEVALDNGGQQIPASDVTLEVLRDGEQVDSFPLATNQVLLNGENTYTTRYIPAEMWEPGTYTFRIVVSAVDPNGGQETILLTEDLDAEIVVP